MDNVKECSKCHEIEAHSRNGSKLQAYCKKCVKAYNAKPEIKEKRKAYAAEYRTKPENKEKMNAYIAEYLAKPEIKEKRKAYAAEYRTKPENKEKMNAYIAEYRAKPEIKERKKAYNAEYLAKPENRERRKARDAEYYAKPENKEKKKARDAEYYAKPENKERIKAHTAEYRAKPENKERIKAYSAEYYAKPENIEKKKAYSVEYRAKPENKKRMNAQMKERRKNDLVFRARECLRSLLHNFLGGISKSEHTQELLGCSYDQFVEYQHAIASPEVLAALAAGVEIHHDHNIPLSVKGIDPRIESHRRAVCHYTNFFWLEHLVNNRKRNHTPEGFNFAAWLEEQTARIAACEGKTPMETIEQNREYIDAAHAFADRFREPSSLTP